MSFGQTLRAAREAKGLTLSKVAHDTRILVQIVADMENEDFHRIPAAIYGRGFVRLFAEEVGLDPAPLVQEFMDIFSGKRAPMSAVPPPPPAEEAPETPAPERDTTPAPLPDESPFDAPNADEQAAYEQTADEQPSYEPIPPAPNAPEIPSYAAPQSEEVDVPPPVTNPFANPEPTEPTPAPEPEPIAAPIVPEVQPQPAVVKGLDLFEQPKQQQVPPPRPAPASSTALPPQIDASSPYLSAGYEDTGVSVGERFRAGLSDISSNLIEHVHNVPRSVWRISLLAVGVILLLALIVFACVKLYQATTPAKDPCANGVCEIELPQKAATDKPKTETKPKTDTKTKPAATPTPETPVAQPTTPAPAPARSPVTPGRLRTTGEAVPSLYMD